MTLLGPKQRAYITNAEREIADIDSGMDPYLRSVQGKVFSDLNAIRLKLAEVDGIDSPLAYLSPKEKEAWREQIENSPLGALSAEEKAAWIEQLLEIWHKQATYVSGFPTAYPMPPDLP